MASSEVSDLLNEQRETAAYLQTLVSNIGKTSTASRTVANRECKSASLEELWEKFRHNHKVLCNELPEDHTYFRELSLPAIQRSVEESQSKLASWATSAAHWDLRPQSVRSPTSPPVAADRFSLSPLQGDIPRSATQSHWSSAVPAAYQTSAHGHAWSQPNYGPGTTTMTTAPAPVQPGFSSPGFNRLPEQHHSYHQRPAAPKLAPITIPCFNGEWKSWTSFIGLFESIIDANPHLAPIEKLQYLLSYLEGSAREAVNHIILEDSNYAVAMEILRRRFANERKLCDEYACKLLDLPRVEARSAAGILAVSTALTTSIHGLRKCNFPIESCAPLVINCVTRKLDEESRQKFEESLRDSRKVPSIDELQDFLDRRYQVLSTEVRKPPQLTSKCFAVTSDNNRSVAIRSDNNKQCHQCHDDSHHLRQCEEFANLSVTKRIQFAKAKQLCLNCLGDHSGECRSRYSCSQCRQRHHSLLHQEKVRTEPANVAAKTDAISAANTAAYTTANTCTRTSVSLFSISKPSARTTEVPKISKRIDTPFDATSISRLSLPPPNGANPQRAHLNNKECPSPKASVHGNAGARTTSGPGTPAMTTAPATKQPRSCSPESIALPEPQQHTTRTTTPGEAIGDKDTTAPLSPAEPTSSPQARTWDLRPQSGRRQRAPQGSSNPARTQRQPQLPPPRTSQTQQQQQKSRSPNPAANTGPVSEERTGRPNRKMRRDQQPRHTAKAASRLLAHHGIFWICVPVASPESVNRGILSKAHIMQILNNISRKRRTASPSANAKDGPPSASRLHGIRARPQHVQL